MCKPVEVEGKNCSHHVKIYTLSTCGWCRKLKNLLKSLDVKYEYVDVDLLTGEAKEKIRAEVKEFNPLASFPTLVIDHGEHVIVGFQEVQVKEVFSE